jgi:flagellar protein FlaG
MSAETFTTAMFLITAVIAAGVLINAVFPVVYNMAGTFSSATHDSDQRLRTDFKIVAYHAKNGAPGDAKMDIYLKNIGSSRIPSSDITRSDVMGGPETNYNRLNYVAGGTSPGQWTTEFVTDTATRLYDLNGNGNWDSGETLHITAYPTETISPGDTLYFQFVLPDGIWRSVTFNAAG